LPEYDAKIMDSIFGTESTKKLSELKNHFYKSIPQIQSAVGARMLSHHYFVRDPVKDKQKFAIVLVVGLFVLMFGGTFIGSFLGILPSLFLVLSYLIVVFFMYFMPARTPAGATAFMHVKGLKNYLEMAEKERIAFHNAPEKKPEVFEKFLPVAMVLGVEKKWAGQFNDIYTTPPSWYSSSGNGAFNAMVFASSLNDFSTQSASSLATAPGSSSGSGGGGFSGGGGGGGGGGSW